MSVISHCLPSGSIGTNEIAVCNVSAGNVLTYTPSGGLGNGNIRGVIVYMTGLPVNIITLTSGTGTATAPSYIANFNNDGWIVIQVYYPEHYTGVVGATAIWNDVNSDTGNGSRYLNNTLMHWWDHVVEYIHATYGPNMPILPHGGSWGGYHTVQIASFKTSTIIAYAAGIPATILSNASTAYTNPANYGTLPNGTTGLDVTQTALNSVNVPGIVMFGSRDAGVGWGYPGLGTLSPSGGVPSNAYISSGLPYSNTDVMIQNAQTAGMPLIRNQTSNIHEFTNDDEGYTAVYSATGPTALSALSTLPLTTVAAGAGIDASTLSSLNSGQCAIWASDNAWHTITFTQFSWTNYCTTTVTNVATSLPSTLTLGSTTGLYLTSGTNYVSITTSGTPLIASYTGVSGSNLTGVSYYSGTGNLTGTSYAIVSLVTYVVTAVSDVNSMPSTLTLNTTHGLDTTGGQLHLTTDSVYFTVVIVYTGISGSTITGVSVIYSAGGTISGTPANNVYQMTSLIGCSYSGNNSATVSLNSPVCMTGMPLVGSNNYYKMAIPYWINQNVDALAPRIY
jgi:hypothetical protein